MNTRSLSILTLISLFMFNTIWASPAGLPIKLVDMLVKDSGVVELLARNGIVGDTARSVQSYVTNSLTALSARNSNLTTDELKQILRDLAVTGDDQRLRNQLLEILDKDAREITRDEVVNAINNLIYLANRHGIRGSVVLACSECVSESLRRNGFRFTFASVQNQSAQEVLENVLPRNPRDLTNYITRRMSAMNIGNYRQAPRELVSPEEERALGLFLGLAEHGSPKQKELIQSILDISRLPSGEIRLLNIDNPHTFWRMFTEDMTDDYMDYWTRILKQTAEESQDQVSKEDAFFRILERNHRDDSISLEYVQMLRSKKCLFK